MLTIGGFVAWTYLQRVSLPALSLAVIAPVVTAQRTGETEPLLFEVSLVSFLIARSAASLPAAAALGVVAARSETDPRSRSGAGLDDDRRRVASRGADHRQSSTDAMLPRSMPPIIL